MPTVTAKPGTGSTSTTRYSGDPAITGNVWSNPGNITVEDSTSATNTGGSGQGRYLIGSNFGFSSTIQAGATINSITGRYKRSKSTGTPTELGCILVGPSGLVSNEMNNSSAYPSSLTDRTFTATFTGTVSDIRDSAFGLSVRNAGTGNVSVDVMELTIDYTNPPVVTCSGGSTSYTENDAATLIDSGITATADVTNLTGATIQITTAYQSSEDTLSFVDQLGITGSWNSGTGTLTLSGTTTAANYQTALRAVKYVNSSEDPTTTSRVCTFITTDGTRSSVGSTKTITITAVSDASPTGTTPPARGRGCYRNRRDARI